MMTEPFITRRRALLIATLLIAGLVGGWWLLARSRYATTDNASMQADIILLSPQVSGYVSEIFVAENRRVRAGQILARVDRQDLVLKWRVAAARQREIEASLMTLDGRARERNALLQEREAALQGAEADRSAAMAEGERIAQLAAEGWATRRSLQNAEANAARAVSTVEQAHAALRAEYARSRTLASERLELQGRIAAARAENDRGKLDLQRAAIVAPVDGVIGRSPVRIGQFVNPGDVLMHIVPVKRRYVIANFREGQLAALRVGQTATIRLDAAPDRVFMGHVESLSPATGSQFAALPIDNANGNFVKIVQRVPVRISLPPDIKGYELLRPGLSARVSVHLRRTR